MTFRSDDLPRRFLLHLPVEPPTDPLLTDAGDRPGHPDPDDADLYRPEVVAWGLELPWGEAVMVWAGSDETSHVLQTTCVERTAARFGRRLGTSMTWLDPHAGDDPRAGGDVHVGGDARAGDAAPAGRRPEPGGADG